MMNQALFHALFIIYHSSFIIKNDKSLIQTYLETPQKQFFDYARNLRGVFYPLCGVEP